MKTRNKIISMICMTIVLVSVLLCGCSVEEKTSIFETETQQETVMAEDIPGTLAASMAYNENQK